VRRRLPIFVPHARRYITHWLKTRRTRPILGPSLADDLTVSVASDGMVEAFGDVGAAAAV
jgi:hypothetical protein